MVRLDDDWLTKGDCLGRYGRYWGCWAAIFSPEDYVWGGGPEKVDYESFIGPNWWHRDGLRCWIQWLFTNNPNSLELPPTYYDASLRRGFMKPGMTRRQAEWDDHGETYPMTVNGPDLYCSIRIPAGTYFLSLYNFNKDGHGGANRYRDFTVSVRPHTLGMLLDRIVGFNGWPELAHGRMRDFWGSQYERYLVRGPTELTIKIDRNHSFCTILAGVFLDLVDEEPLPYFHTLPEWKEITAKQADETKLLSKEAPADHAARFQAAGTEAEAAARCFAELEAMRRVNVTWWARDSRPFYAAALRWALQAQKSAKPGPEKTQLLVRATTCYYHLAWTRSGSRARWRLARNLPARSRSPSSGTVPCPTAEARAIRLLLRTFRTSSFSGRLPKTDNRPLHFGTVKGEWHGKHQTQPLVGVGVGGFAACSVGISLFLTASGGSVRGRVGNRRAGSGYYHPPVR